MDSLFCIKLIFNFCMDDGAVSGVYEDVVADGSGCDADFIHGVEGALRHSSLRRLAFHIRLARLSRSSHRRLALGRCHGGGLVAGLAVGSGFGRSTGSGIGLFFTRTARFHAFWSALVASFIAFAVSVLRFFFVVAFAVILAAVFRTVLGAAHIEEGDFFEIQFTFVLADGLGGSGAGLVFTDEGDVVLVGLGLGHLGHGVDPFGVTGQMLLVQIVVAAGRGYDADDAEGSSDFCIAGRADFIFNRNECILPFFLGHDEFLLSSITYS
jgi:hypothetical protein